VKRSPRSWTLIGLALVCALRARAEARRIVSLAPSVTETLFAVGAGDDVVGTTDLSDFPPAAQKIDRVGSYMQPNVEAVVAHRPDVVIAVPSPGNRESVEAIAALGIPVVIVEEGPAVGDVLGSIRRIAEEAGKAEEGRALAGRIHDDIERVRARTGSLPRKRVLMVVGQNPFVAVGDGTLLDELMRAAGADNVAANLGRWPRLSVEYVIRSDPDIIIDSSMGDEATAGASFYRDLALRAVREGRLYAIRLDEMLRPGPRLADGLVKLAGIIHPDAFRKPDSAR
jgi:iron complex transport system substrate-binding protein